jgi:hypothetical protein
MSGQATITTIPTQDRSAGARSTATEITTAARGTPQQARWPTPPEPITNRAAQATMPLGRRAGALHGWLTYARAELDHTTHVLGGQAPDPAELHTAIDGVLNVTTTLAELVETLIRQTPASLTGHTEARLPEELQADLRALHGCLTTGSLLVTASRDELAELGDRDGQP